MTSQKIIENLNHKIQVRLEEKKVLKASELNDLSTVELMLLAVYSTNRLAIWRFKKIDSSEKFQSIDQHGNRWHSDDWILELRVQT